MTICPDGGGRFDDWDSPADAGSAIVEPSEPSTGLFLDSPLYSIENYRRLIYIKDSLSIAIRISGLLLLPLGLNALAFIISPSPFGYDYWTSFTELAIFIAFILALLSIIYYFLKKPASLTFSLYAAGIPLLLYLIFIINYPYPWSALLLRSYYTVAVIIILGFLAVRAKRTHAAVRELEEAKHHIPRRNLKDAIISAYSNTFEFFNRAKAEIIPCSLSDRLETTLLKQLTLSAKLDNSIINRCKTQLFRNTLRDLSKHNRICVLYTTIMALHLLFASIINPVLYKSETLYFFIVYIPVVATGLLIWRQI